MQCYRTSEFVGDTVPLGITLDPEAIFSVALAKPSISLAPDVEFQGGKRLDPRCAVPEPGLETGGGQQMLGAHHIRNHV